VGAGVLFQHHVVLADRVRFLLRSQRHHRSRRCSSRPPRLLSRNRRLSSPTLTRGLLAPITPGPASRAPSRPARLRRRPARLPSHPRGLPTRLPSGPSRPSRLPSDPCRPSRQPGRLSRSGRLSGGPGGLPGFGRPRRGPACATSSRPLPPRRYVVPRIRLRRHIVVLRIRRLLQGNRRTRIITPLPDPRSPAGPGTPSRAHRRLTAARLIPSCTSGAPTRTRTRSFTSAPRASPRLRATLHRSRSTTATRTRAGSTPDRIARAIATRAGATYARPARAGSPCAGATHAGSTRAGTTGRTTNSRTAGDLPTFSGTSGSGTARDLAADCRASGSRAAGSRPVGSGTCARAACARTSCAWTACARVSRLWAARAGSGWLVAAACAGVG
jgi:hypothetical protein